MTTWLVRLTDVTLEWSERWSRVAINCLVAEPVGGLEPRDIAPLVRHDVTGQRSHYARELAYLATDMQPGDLVLGTSSATRSLLVGRVAGDYEFLDEPVADCRHARRVAWGATTTWSRLEAAGADRPGQEVRAVARLALPAGLEAELADLAG
jgi:hypothetical protein